MRYKYKKPKYDTGHHVYDTKDRVVVSVCPYSWQAKMIVKALNAANEPRSDSK